MEEVHDEELQGLYVLLRQAEENTRAEGLLRLAEQENARYIMPTGGDRVISFCPCPVNLKELKLRVLKQRELNLHNITAEMGGAYELDISQPAFAALRNTSSNGVGCLSPRADINLGEEMRTRANIPKKATSFAFAYPVVEAASVHTEAPHSLLFAARGGFVYFDMSRNLCGVNVMKRGEGLRQNTPHSPHTRPAARLLPSLPGFASATQSAHQTQLPPVCQSDLLL